MKRWRDSLISWWTGYEYTHCELVYHTNMGTITVTANYGRPVCCVLDKGYTNTAKWKLHGLPLSGAQQRELWRFCATQIDKPYNTLGFYWNFFPCLNMLPAYDSKGQAWICSELILSGLQRVTTPRGHPCYHKRLPCRTSPNQLHRMIVAQGGQLVGAAPQTLASDSVARRGDHVVARKAGARPENAMLV